MQRAWQAGNKKLSPRRYRDLARLALPVRAGRIGNRSARYGAEFSRESAVSECQLLAVHLLARQPASIEALCQRPTAPSRWRSAMRKRSPRLSSQQNLNEINDVCK